MTAVQVPASGDWIGNAGPWPSFLIQIGNGSSPQVVEVVAATSKANIWPVLSDYCKGIPESLDCKAFRGGFYYPALSNTFDKIQGQENYFDLPFDSESPLGYNGSAIAGTDYVRLGPLDGDSVYLGEQALTAFTYSSPFIATGFLGLSNQTFYVKGGNDPHVSPLSALRETGQIPSSFWGYNAGAQYTSPKTDASLTFGGYDAGRGGDLKDALRVSMQGDEDRDLVVSLEAVSIGAGGTKRVGSAINAYIDSVVPDLWLPEDVCKIFEDAFDLQWNETAQMYILDQAQLNRLYSDTQAKVTFTLADRYGSSSNIEISFAYAAFDKLASYPLAGIQNDSSLQYFPLKRATDPSQYYLGHAFLQEAYLAADYDRGEFYLSQAKFFDDDGSPQASFTKTVFPPGHGSKLSTGAIVGIAVGVAVAMLLVAGLVAWFCCRPRWKKRRNSRFRAHMEAQNADLPASQLPSFQETEMQEYYAKRPLSPDGSDLKQELDATTTARGSVTSRAEMESPGHSSMGSPRKMGSRRTSYGFPTSPAELEGRSPRMMHSRTASGGSVEPMSPLSGVGRTGLGRTSEEVHELP